MRILLLATKYFGHGGAEAYTRWLAQAASDEGAQVDVLSLLDGEAADRTCPGRYLGDQGARSTRWAQARFVGRALARARSYDLMVCSHVAVAPIGRVASQWFGIPYLVLGYGIDMWGPLPAGRRAALQRATGVEVISHFTARMVAGVQGVAVDRIHVIHPIVDPALLAQASAAAPRSGESSRGVTLLTVARLSARERYKGFETVMSALPGVAAAAGRVRYVVVGDGDDVPRLRAFARERGVEAMVTFAGAARGAADLAAWYRACDIFVMPSVCEQRSDGWAGEGFGIVYIEASAFGRPVVAGSGGGAPEAVQDGVTGLVVDGRDPAQVGAALVRLIQDAALRARMGEAGRRRALEYFTFDRFRREAGAVLRDLHAASSPAGGGAQTAAVSRIERPGRAPRILDFYNAEDDQRYGRAELPEDVQALRRLLARHGIGGDELIVDLGCGKGPLRGFGRRHLGLDLSRYALSRFRGAPWCVQGDAQKVPVRTARAAVVVSVATLEHLPAPDRCLEEIDRVLRPGGLAYLAPAWFCRPWASQGLGAKSYRELPLRDRLYKAALPLLNNLLVRSLWILPVRIIREARFRLRSRPVPLAFRRLRPNLVEYVDADSDASAAIDPHAAILYFLSRGYDVLSAPTLGRRLLARNAPVIVRKPL